MLVTYSHSRAAILCFGGWGLQVMLHLAPRLQIAQEQRAALGAVGPNLNRITSFGAVIPEPLLAGGGMAQFCLRRLHPDRVLPPFYIERLLVSLQQAAPENEERTGLLTAAERRASALLRAAEPELQPIMYDGYEFRTRATGLASLGRRGAATATGIRRATRTDMFQTALEHSDHVARLVETHILDPIRQDNLAPDDPFVQTTLYVVAPLFEPLASALVWPLVAGMMARLGRRHISTVVGLFATGSYAGDLTRSVEDAGVYATLSELEILTGLREDKKNRSSLATMIRGVGSPLAGYVGESLFDHIYLLDREKSNQGLAKDSHELAVLASNALEAFVVGSGDLFIQEQLGFTAQAGEARPYSLIGASADYVPLNQIFHAVNRQEESRLVRDWVLRNTVDEAQGANPLARWMGNQTSPDLVDLGFAQAQALHQLALRMPDLFDNPEPAEIDDLGVKPSFVFPRAAAADLRRLSPNEWPIAFKKHMEQIYRTFDLAAGPAAIGEAWGLAPAGNDSSLGFAAGLEADDRLFPQLLVRMHKRLLDLLAAAPTGLARAESQTQRWLHEAEEALQKLQVASTPSTRQLRQIRHDLALREWTVQYGELTAKLPSFKGILLRAILATGLVAVLAFGYLLAVGRNWNRAMTD